MRFEVEAEVGSGWRIELGVWRGGRYGRRLWARRRRHEEASRSREADAPTKEL